MTAERPPRLAPVHRENAAVKIISPCSPLWFRLSIAMATEHQSGWVEGRLSRSLVCECEAVTAGEVQYAVENLTVNSLLDLRRRTASGWAPVRGSCACRAAWLLQRFSYHHRHPVARSAQRFSERALERHSACRPRGRCLCVKSELPAGVPGFAVLKEQRDEI